MSNKSNFRQLRRQTLLISPNHQNDNTSPSVECSLVNFNHNRQFAERQNGEAESDTSTFKIDTIRRMQKFCGKRLLGVQCVTTLEIATSSTETTLAAKVASGNPSWMIPVIIVAVVVAVILGIVAVLGLLRKTGFYRVRKKVKPDDKDKK